MPTVKESGLPDHVYESSFGVMPPGAVPRPIFNKVNRVIVRAFQMPDVAQKMKNQASWSSPRRRKDSTK